MKRMSLPASGRGLCTCDWALPCGAVPGARLARNCCPALPCRALPPHYPRATHRRYVSGALEVAAGAQKVANYAISPAEMNMCRRCCRRWRERRECGMGVLKIRQVSVRVRLGAPSKSACPWNRKTPLVLIRAGGVFRGATTDHQVATGPRRSFRQAHSVC